MSPANVIVMCLISCFSLVSNSELKLPCKECQMTGTGCRGEKIGTPLFPPHPKQSWQACKFKEDDIKKWEATEAAGSSM